jgi:hypothetical protein
MTKMLKKEKVWIGVAHSCQMVYFYTFIYWSIGIENLGIFYYHWEYSTAIRYILWPFRIFWVVWYVFPVLVCWSKKNLATSVLPSCARFESLLAGHTWTGPPTYRYAYVHMFYRNEIQAVVNFFTWRFFINLIPQKPTLHSPQEQKTRVQILSGYKVFYIRKSLQCCWAQSTWFALFERWKIEICKGTGPKIFL